MGVGEMGVGETGVGETGIPLFYKCQLHAMKGINLISKDVNEYSNIRIPFPNLNICLFFLHFPPLC